MGILVALLNTLVYFMQLCNVVFHLGPKSKHHVTQMGHVMTLWTLIANHHNIQIGLNEACEWACFSVVSCINLHKLSQHDGLLFEAHRT